MKHTAPQIALKSDVLYGADQAVAALVKQIAGVRKGDWQQFTALGVVKDGRLIGGVVFHNYRPEAADIEITAGFSTPKWCSPQTLAEILRYPIEQLGCRRCTARTAAGNWRARRFLERLGFREEGVLRRAYDGKEDMVVYGVLREQGNWKESW